MTTIPTLFVYFLYDHIPTLFYIFKKCFLLLVIIYNYIILHNIIEQVSYIFSIIIAITS